MNTTIFIENLSLFGIHGHDAIAKGQKREFILSIYVVIDDIEPSLKSGELEDTFDYHIAIAEAERVMSGPSCKLIEELGNKILESIKKHKHVQKIKLTLSKRELLHGAVSGITIESLGEGQ